jgi:hypothetical protein
MSRPLARRMARWLGVYAAYQAFVLALTWPTVAQLTTHGVGGPDKGGRDHLWFVWWAEQVFWGDEASFGHISYLNFPDGYATFSTFHNVFNEIVEQPLHLLGPPVMVYNVVILVSMALAGVTAYAATRLHVKDRGACLVAGLFFLCAPVIWGALNNGESELVTYYFVPLAYLALVRMVERRSWSWAAGAGVVLALTSYGAWYFGIEMLLFALLYVSFRAAQAARADGWREGLRVVALGALAATAFVVVIGPHVLMLRNHMHEDVVFTVDVPNIEHFFWPATPAPDYVPHSVQRVGEAAFYSNHYIGWVLIALAAYGYLRGRIGDRKLLLAMASLFFVLALGKFLRWGHRGTTFGEYLVPLPMMALYHIRLFRGIHKSYRWVVLVRLLLGILAAGGLAALARGTPRRRALVLGGSAALFMVEFALIGIRPGVLPLERFDVREETIPSVYRTVRDDPERVALVELPATIETRPVSEYLFFQTYHQHPLVGPLALLLEPSIYGEVAGRYRALEATCRQLNGLADLPAQQDALREQLREARIRYVVYHPSLATERIAMELDVDAIRAAALSRERADDGTELFVMY